MLSVFLSLSLSLSVDYYICLKKRESKAHAQKEVYNSQRKEKKIIKENKETKKNS
jgi:hypothetical protein